MQTETYLIDLLGPYMLGMLISLAIGLMLGLEREYDKIKDEIGIAGIRTFPIATVLGFMMGSLAESFSTSFLLVGTGAFIIFLGWGQVFKTKEAVLGLTTYLALITTFLLGIMVSLGLYRDSVATAVIILTLLSMKGTFRSIIQNITLAELFAFIKFAILSLLILPFLPNKDYGAGGLLNPFEIGTIVVVVSFINFFGYFLVKFVGSRKGILLTAILGGLISSTAVAWDYAARSREGEGWSRDYAAGIIIASAIMFPRLLLLAGIFNPAIMLPLLLPTILLTLICIVPAFLFIRAGSKEADTQIGLGNPLNIVNALSFALIYIIILYAVYYGNEYFGESGLFYSSLIAGLADTTAITISMAKFALNGQLTLSALVIVAATLSNTVVKLGIVFFRGAKTTSRLVSLVFGALIAVGTIYIFVML